MSLELRQSGENSSFNKNTQIQSQEAKQGEINGFAGFNLNPKLIKTLNEISFINPTPIQSQAIPVVLSGSDLIGNAQTGTGKTAAFVLPLLTKLMAVPYSVSQTFGPEVLILAPTRELAAQISENIRTLANGTGIRSSVIYGGVAQSNQIRDLDRNYPRILVATPGRLLDLINQRYLDLKSVNVLVLDEADRMLDMGFIQDIKRIVVMLPKKRQTLMFSATMPQEIVSFAKNIMQSPKQIAVDPVSSAVKIINQFVVHVGREQKRAALLQLLKDPGMVRTLVFTRTKHVADRVAKYLSSNQISTRVIHANKSQSARQSAMSGFKSGHVPVLVATDIASRGIDVEDVSHVINYDLPEVPETYIHRIGRTGRAKKSGVAISLCDAEQKRLLNSIERHLGKPIPVYKNIIISNQVTTKSKPPVIPTESRNNFMYRNFKHPIPPIVDRIYPKLSYFHSLILDC